MTWSCYKGLDLHCGTCATCLERKYALEFDAGIDPTRYLS
jgi:7-cyano-7-deazaguanine synthase